MREVGKWPPKFVYTLITGTCENVRLRSKEIEVPDGIKIANQLTWDKKFTLDYLDS